MDSNGSHLQAKTRERIENDLLEKLREKQIEWVRASDQERDAARQRFLDALHSFNGFVLDGSVPKGQ